MEASVRAIVTAKATLILGVTQTPETARVILAGPEMVVIKV